MYNIWNNPQKDLNKNYFVDFLIKYKYFSKVVINKKEESYTSDQRTRTQQSAEIYEESLINDF
jgi:hypothetical protein